jgi:hypothetical protein
MSVTEIPDREDARGCTLRIVMDWRTSKVAFVSLNIASFMESETE